MKKIITDRRQMGRMLDDASSIKKAADAIIAELDYTAGRTLASVDYIREKLDKIQRCLDFLKAQEGTDEE